MVQNIFKEDFLQSNSNSLQLTLSSKLNLVLRLIPTLVQSFLVTIIEPLLSSLLQITLNNPIYIAKVLGKTLASNITSLDFLYKELIIFLFTLLIIRNLKILVLLYLYRLYNSNQNTPRIISISISSFIDYLNRLLGIVILLSAYSSIIRLILFYSRYIRYTSFSLFFNPFRRPRPRRGGYFNSSSR